MATLSVEQMRGLLYSAYHGARWTRKVEAMSDHQVIAVYRRMAAKGAFDRSSGKAVERTAKEPREDAREARVKFDTHAGEQLSIDDLLR